VNDLKTHEHGDEGDGSTHWVCSSRLEKEGGKAQCCGCFPHEGCNNEGFNQALSEFQRTIKKLKEL